MCGHITAARLGASARAAGTAAPDAGSAAGSIALGTTVWASTKKRSNIAASSPASSGYDLPACQAGRTVARANSPDTRAIRSAATRSCRKHPSLSVRSSPWISDVAMSAPGSRSRSTWRT